MHDQLYAKLGDRSVTGWGSNCLAGTDVERFSTCRQARRGKPQKPYIERQETTALKGYCILAAPHVPERSAADRPSLTSAPALPETASSLLGARHSA